MFIVQRWMTSCTHDPMKTMMLAKPLMPMLTPFFQREKPTKLHVDTRSHQPTVTEVL